MDFTRPCLSPVCAPQQLALCGRTGPGKQDVCLWAFEGRKVATKDTQDHGCWGLQRHPLASLKEQHEP